MEMLLTSKELCRRYRVSPTTLWRWRRSGKLAALKTPGGGLRFRESDVQNVLEKEILPA